MTFAGAGAFLAANPMVTGALVSGGFGMLSSARNDASARARAESRMDAPDLDFSNNNGKIEGMQTGFLARNEAQISSLANQQFNLGAAMLQPQFAESRSVVSNALSSRKMGRTSTFANAMESLAGKEQTAYTSLLSDTLKLEQQDQLQRTSLRANMEQAGLSSRTNRYNAYLGYLSEVEKAEASRSSGESAGMGSVIGSIMGAFGKS